VARRRLRRRPSPTCLIRGDVCIVIKCVKAGALWVEALR
jgi:hypothetical protein